LLEQRDGTPDALARGLMDFMTDTDARERTRQALAQWHAPQAARQIAEAMLKEAGVEGREFASAGRLQVCDPADYKSALPSRGAA
jgi:hypothetical protein